MPIASCLVDTNILLRITRRSDPQHKTVDTALSRLAGQGTSVYQTATRFIGNGGEWWCTTISQEFKYTTRV
jgi:hypothetical protein